MTGHTVDYRCRQCGARHAIPTDDGPETLRWLTIDEAGKALPPAIAIHECSPKLRGVADVVGCTMPGPTG